MSDKKTADTQLDAGLLADRPAATTVVAGTLYATTDDDDKVYRSNGATWDEWIDYASAGGPPTGAAGGVLDGTYPNPGLAAAVAGDGLAETTNVLSVNVDNSSIELSADALRVKAGGITAAMVAADVATQAELDAVAGAAVPKSLYDANTILAADTDDTPAALTMGASTILARLAAGNIKAATPAELRTLLALVIGTNVQAWDADLDSIAALATTAYGRALLTLADGPALDALLGEVTGGGGDISIADTNYVTLCSQAYTVVAGDSFIIDVDFLILNNSGGTKTYTMEIAVGTFVAEVVMGTTIAASATARAYAQFHGCAEIRANNLAFAGARADHSASLAANTAGSEVLLQDRFVWNTSTSDFTGAQTVAMKIKSAAATATQTATVLGWRIRKV